MTDAELIDRTIRYADNVDPSAGENTTKRTRYVEFAQEGVEEFWHQQEWRWSQSEDALDAIDTRGETDLPDDFLEVGRYGHLVDNLGEPFSERSAGELKQLQASPSGAVKTYIYSIGGVNDAVLVPRGWAGQVLTMFYKMVAPTFSDGGEDGALAVIPVTYHYRVLIPYMRWRAFDDRGDERSAFWFERYQAGLEQALKTEKPGKDTTHRVGGSGLRDMC